MVPVANPGSRGYSHDLIWENTMNNAELAETLVANHALSKADARKAVDGLLAAIVAAAAAHARNGERCAGAGRLSRG